MTLHDLLTSTTSLLHLSTTGAGLDLQAKVWSIPGSSHYLVGGYTPYSYTQQRSFLGHLPEARYVSAEHAFDMAMASYIRASEAKFTEGLNGHPVGLGMSAAVATTHLPHSDQQAYVVLITQSTVNVLHIPLEKSIGEIARRFHDQTITEGCLQLLHGVLEGTVPSQPGAEELALQRFYRYPIFQTDGTRLPPEERKPSIYLPATLNPIHDGHRAFCHIAEDALSPDGPGRVRACYLVSSVSPHKGRLTVQDMLFKAGMLRAERWQPHQQSRTVEFTYDEPLFIDKARKRPGSVFLIGADAMEQMLDSKWGLDIDKMLTEMRNLGVQFYVMGRLIRGKWTTCQDIKVPWSHQNLFKPLDGRVDISSTELRKVANE